MLGDAVQVGILTCEGYEKFKVGDFQIIKALEKHNIAARHVVWNSSSEVWRKCKSIVVRSTWDYCQDRKTIECFRKLLREISSNNILLLNPLKTIEWNISKTYLKELKAKGVPVLDTLWLAKDELDKLESQLCEKGWQECVIKPVVSAGGMHTRRFNMKEVAQIVDACKQKDVDGWMVQPFAQEIITEGERSFVFIENVFSHCVLKRPAKESFLVNETQGGMAEKEIPHPWMVEQASQILLAAGQNCLFARVDAICRDKTLILMELEVIEPLLYEECEKGFAETFALALVKRLQNEKSS